MKPLSFSNPNVTNRSVVVSASAGSGKTFTLSVIVLLAIGRMEVKSHEVLATTFSEAAAADLRERLLRPLNLLNSFDAGIWKKILSTGPSYSTVFDSLDIVAGELTEAFQHFGDQPWMETPIKAQSFWRRARREAELIQVSTLHGLALGLLRAGKGSPDRILETEHPALLRLLRQAMREITDIPESDPDYAPACELQKWAEGQWDAISRGYDSLRDALGIYEDEISEKVRLDIHSALRRTINALCRFIVDPNLAKNLSSPARRYFDSKKILPMPSPEADLQEQIRWAERQSAILDSEVGELPGYYSEEFKNAIQNLRTVAGVWERWLKQILGKSLRRFEKLKQARRVATFGDLVRSALEGLNDGSIAPPCPKLLLIDEYQDTSLAQDAFLKALGADRTIRVGDVKQAVYGFRGGTSDLLKMQIEDAEDCAFKLPYNFRSAPPIVDLSNAFVDEVWPKVDPSAKCFDGLQISKTAGNCPVGVALVQSTSKGTDLPVLSEWIIALSHESGWEKTVGLDAKAGLHPTRALLLRQRTKLPALLFQIKRKGIQPYVLATDGFWDSPGVRLMMTALEAYAHPNRKLPCAVLLRHLAGLTDSEINRLGNFRGIDSLDIEAISAEKRRQVSFLQSLALASTNQIASNLLAQGNLLAVIASLDAHGAMEPERARRNLAGLLAMLQGLPANPGIAYAMLDELRRGPERGDLPSTSQDADLIIQTVHASKGLEYDSVILPLLNNKKQSIRKGRMLTDPSDKSLLFAWKLGVEPGDDYKKIAKLTELQQSRDDLNLLYVAITRAKKRMCLLIQVPPNTKSKENQYYSWARLGMELHGHSEKLLRIENPPAITVKQKSNNPPLVKQSNKLALGDCPKHSPVHADARGFAEKEHSRQEGLKMHAYLQNLLLRWNDTEAFNNILNCPPSVPNARECAVQFLDSFESRGWRHLRRRTEIDLQDGSPNGTKGRADLIVWENDCIHIIDFKHIHKLSKENESIYSQQLNRYADALPQDGIKIRGWLALLKSGVWKELRISKNDASAKVFS